MSTVNPLTFCCAVCRRAKYRQVSAQGSLFRRCKKDLRRVRVRIASQYLGWMMRYRKSAEVTVGLNRVMLAFAVFRSELKAGWL